MSLGYRLVELENETLQGFELAAEERYMDALELVSRGNATGGVYVAGYVAEMLLKNAVFRFDGARPSDEIAPRLGPVRKWAKMFLPLIDHDSYHSIWFWALVLRKKRRNAGKLLPEDMDGELVRRARRIHQGWSVALRYHGFVVGMDDARRIIADVSWLRSRSSILWR